MILDLFLMSSRQVFRCHLYCDYDEIFDGLFTICGKSAPIVYRGRCVKQWDGSEWVLRGASIMIPSLQPFCPGTGGRDPQIQTHPHTHIHTTNTHTNTHAHILAHLLLRGTLHCYNDVYRPIAEVTIDAHVIFRQPQPCIAFSYFATGPPLIVWAKRLSKVILVSFIRWDISNVEEGMKPSRNSLLLC